MWDETVLCFFYLFAREELSFPSYKLKLKHSTKKVVDQISIGPILWKSEKILFEKNASFCSQFYRMTAGPGLEKHSCHGMIMAKHSQDRGTMTAGRPCFLKRSPWFMIWSWYEKLVFLDSYFVHGMIVMFSMYSGKMDFLCQLASNSHHHIPLYSRFDWT